MSQNGKGSSRRGTSKEERKKFSDNYDIIFGQKNKILSDVSELPCILCGVKHHLNEFPAYDCLVKVINNNSKYYNITGNIIEWTQYGCPISYRIEFTYNGKYEREFFYPCELKKLRRGKPKTNIDKCP